MQKLFIFLLLIVVASYNCDSVSAQDNEQVPLHPIATQGQGNSNETGTVRFLLRTKVLGYGDSTYLAEITNQINF